jgi:SAM-dependent methyltransferase
MDTPQTSGRDILREFFKRWPAFYYFIAKVFGPVWFTGLNPVHFLEKYEQEGIKVNLGSGPRKIRADVMNVDGEPYTGVDVVADITSLPIESNSVSMIICDNVLEHVPDSKKAVAEIYRILKPGGVAYISTPFLYPFHSSPNDYHRWTDQGLRVLFSEFCMREMGVRSGIMSGFSIMLSYIFARAFSFGSDRMHWFLVNIALFIFFPIKLLDIAFNLLPGGLKTASVLYCVIEKQNHGG